MDQRVARRLADAAVGIGGPLLLTALLTRLQIGVSRDHAFLYLALVAGLGLSGGLAPSLLAAAVSFLRVDSFFVEPLHALTIADATDWVNLIVFFSAAGVIGGLSSRRRHSQLQADALSRRLTDANEGLERLNRPPRRMTREGEAASDPRRCSSSSAS